MRTKRGAAVLLSLCLLIGLFAPVRAMAQGEFSPVVLSLSSNLSSADRLEGYYRDQVFYVDVDDACGLAGMTIWSQSQNLVEISEGGKRGGRPAADVHPGGEGYPDGDLLRRGAGGSHAAEVIGEEVCVSLFHFLTYMGVGYELDPEGDPQLTVVKWFDMLDLLHEYAASDRGGNYFRWSEIDFNFGDAELNLTYQGVLAPARGGVGSLPDDLPRRRHLPGGLGGGSADGGGQRGGRVLESETNPLKILPTPSSPNPPAGTVSCRNPTSWTRAGPSTRF